MNEKKNSLEKYQTEKNVNSSIGKGYGRADIKKLNLPHFQKHRKSYPGPVTDFTKRKVIDFTN